MAETLAILGLVAAAPPIIEGIFKSWDSVVRKRDKYRHLTSLARDLRSFGTDDSRTQLSADITLARQVLQDDAILSEHKARILRIFQRIQLQLEQIDSLVDAVLEKPNRTWFLRRLNESKELRNSVEQTKRDIGEFHGLVLSFREISKSEIGTFLRAGDFCLTVDAEKKRITLNDTTFVARGSRALPGRSSQVGLFVFESKYYDLGDKQVIYDQMRSLSNRLLRAEPTYQGILPLIGFRDQPEDDEYQLVFSYPFSDNLPDNHCLVTLKNFYGSSAVKPSLNFRIDLCRQLAEAILQTHTLGLVHKSVRPDNILLCFPKASPGCIPSLYLSGWHLARPVSGNTTVMAGEPIWQKAIYQHPTRQTTVAEEEYCIGHDIYSLGVCMLEILMWDPLVVVNNSNEEEPTISQLYQTIYSNLGLASDCSNPATGPTNITWVTRVPQDVQRVLVEMAATHLPSSAGERMADLVRQCLTCLVSDSNHAEFTMGEAQARKEISEGFVDIILGGICSVSSVI